MSEHSIIQKDDVRKIQINYSVFFISTETKMILICFGGALYYTRLKFSNYEYVSQPAKNTPETYKSWMKH